MRALLCREYGLPESLVIAERDDAVAGEGQVLVDVAAAGINFPDVLEIAGQYQVRTPPPFVPGNEGAGTIAALGAGVTRFAVGDRVMFTAKGGSFAGKCAVDQNMCMPLPRELSFEQGAGFTVTYATSYHALKQSARLRAGETALVLGAAGGVGVTAVEIAKLMGAHVIAAASSDEKLAFAKTAGADQLINYTTQPLKDTVKEMTGGAGVDVVYDPVGGQLADQAYRAMAWHGRYLVIGFACGDIPKFAANIALLKEASIVGVWWGTWAAKNPGLHAQNMQEMTELVAEGRLAPRVSESYSLDEYISAFKAITGRRARGKVILRMT